MPSFSIRPERTAESAEITTVIDAAFRGMPYAAGDEAALVAELRRLGELAVSLVAEEAGRLVGHVAFSPAYPTDGSAGWYALGPIAVLPERQHSGIASALMTAGLEAIARLGGRGCILVGHPQLYQRFGFANAPENAPADEPAEFFMRKLFTESAPLGPIRFHPAFRNTARPPVGVEREV